MSVRRFTRYVLGEGLVKEQKDFAAEVSAAVGGAKK
jgi:translation elongation factor EF-Ts